MISIQESWKELFLLNLAQWGVPFDMTSVLESNRARERLPKDSLVSTVY